MTRKKETTLRFSFSPEQLAVLTRHPDQDVPPAEAALDTHKLEFSYRAWNAAFVACTEPCTLTE